MTTTKTSQTEKDRHALLAVVACSLVAMGFVGLLQSLKQPVEAHSVTHPVLAERVP